MSHNIYVIESNSKNEPIGPSVSLLDTTKNQSIKKKNSKNNNIVKYYDLKIVIFHFDIYFFYWFL